MTADCLFCKIAAGELPGHILYEDEAIVAFLDINPIREGHTQIVPRAHHACFDDLPPELAARILHLGQRLAAAQKRLYGVRRVAFCFTGSDVPHAHAHLLPMHAPTDITSRRYIVEEKITFRTPPRIPDVVLDETASRFRREFDNG
jgi:histidine triad (HIT) family protein